MHILLALVGVLTFIAVWYWRLRMITGAARHGYNAARKAAGRRRLPAPSHGRRTGLSAVHDPREAAAIMMLEVARTPGGTISDKRDAAIRAEMIDHFGFTPDQAEQLLAHAAWLTRQAPASRKIVEQMSRVVLAAPDMTMKDYDDLSSMLENVAVADGKVSSAERDLIQIWRNRAGLN